LIRAVATRAPELVVSHRSAVVLHGLPVLRAADPVVHLTRAARSGGTVKGIRRVHARPRPSDDVVELDGIRVTAVDRSLVDHACSTTLRQAVIALDGGLQDRLVHPADLSERVAGLSGRSGAGIARLAFAFADGRSESAGESLLRVVLHELGLPQPELQLVVRDRRGSRLGRVDLGYPDCAVVIEFDGKTKYLKYLVPGQTTADAVIAEKARENRIAECGYVVLRVIWAELFRPGELRSRVEQARTRGRRAVDAGLVSGSLTPTLPIRVG